MPDKRKDLRRTEIPKINYAFMHAFIHSDMLQCIF